MEDLLTPVKTVKKVQGNIEKFESLSLKDDPRSKKDPRQLNSNTSRSKRSILELEPTTNEEPILKVAKPLATTRSNVVEELKSENIRKHERHISAAFIEQSYLQKPVPSSLTDDAREVLRRQPNHEDLIAVLQYLQFGIDGRHDFNVRRTNPRAAQIINILVTVTIPDVWANIKQKELSRDEARMKKIIVSSLRSVAGIGALLTQIKHLSSTHGNDAVLGDTIMVLGEVLKGSATVYHFIQDARNLYEELERRFYWQEMTVLIAGGRILSTIAQTFATAKILSDNAPTYLWLADGEQYVGWLAKNIIDAATRLNASDEESWKFLSQIVKRGMNIGHRIFFVSEIYRKLLLGQRAYWTPLHLILEHLAPYEQKAFFDCIVSDLAQRYLASAGGPAIAFSHDLSLQKVVAGAAALIAGLVGNNAVLEEHMESWLSGVGNSSTTIGLSSRRVLVAAFGRSEDKLQRILEKSLANFGDKLQIQHAPTLQQEATAQTILLILGSLNRIDTNLLKRPSLSTLVMHAVSNRLAASIPRARILGMIVGTAVSGFVDKPKDVIDFGTNEMNGEDVKMWLELVTVNDNIGDLTDLQPSPSTTLNSNRILTRDQLKVETLRRNAAPMISKIVAIDEVSDTTDSDDDNDLTPYQKPDTDAEDSEDDPTLINRNKPSAPVYVVNLIEQLQTSGKLDIVAMALKTAPSLIRRKSAFGTEVSDNVNSLVTILVNLQEGMSDPNLQEMRLEGLIACLVAKPELVGPSLSELYFQGDFSLFQRITILTAIGLATRQIAGFENDQTHQTAEDFPSKRLPAHLEPQPQREIAATRNPIEMLTESAAHHAIRPMAFAAADKVTGPSALKIRTFSSRMEVEKKKQEKKAARTKKIPKNLYKLLTESFYIPLCSRMSLLLSHTSGGHLPNTTILHSSTIRLFLQTLTLIFHTLGPSASLHLPTLTHETLLLLMNLHTVISLSVDPAILPTLLHLLLVLLDITVEAGVSAQERLITEYGVQVTELINWSNGLGNKISVPDTDENSISWTVLAAGIQVKWHEIGQRFQARMLGLSLDEMEQLAGS